MPTTETHFVTRVVVERVDKVTPDHRGAPSQAPPPERVVTELASIALKDRTLAGLKGRVTQHVDLVEDL